MIEAEEADSAWRKLLRRLRGGSLVNSIWLVSDKVFKMGLSVVVGAMVARYLGPTNYGELNYAFALAAIFLAASNLGLEAVVVRSMVRGDAEESELVSTALGMQALCGALLCMVLLVFVATTKGLDDGLLAMTAFAGASIAIQNAGALKYWFQRHLRSREVVVSEGWAGVLVGAMRLSLVYLRSAVSWFAAAFAIESLIGFALVAGKYHRLGGRLATPRWKLAGSLLKESWPIAFSNIAIFVYTRIDQVMVEAYLGKTELGLYSAATRISEMWYFVPMAISTSLYPAIIRAKETDDAEYRRRMRQMTEILFVIGLAAGIGGSIFSGLAVRILFGEAYGPSAQILSVQIWAGVFVCLGVAITNWFMAEGLQRLTFYRSVAGAVANVALNFVLIPRYGAIGAAWATVASQALASFLLNAVGARSRPAFLIQLGSIMAPLRLLASGLDSLKRRSR